MEKKRHALRKLLEAVEKELLKKPNRKTLDRLSLLAGFQDWESFKETLNGDLGGETIYGGHQEDNKKETSRKWNVSFLCRVGLDYSLPAIPLRFSLMRAALPVSLRR